MNIRQIIAKKRDGGTLTDAEIRFVVEGVTHGSLPDYQASAWLMAVFLRGMSDDETLHLTLAMRDSGERVDLRDLPNGPALDKHSTGGVGDKTTLIVVPIVAACGVPMLKMSGRGLGFSGGTVDKLESIPGVQTDLSIEQARQQVRDIGAALIGQSERLAPADRVLYALRDVTATVESVPLIASSIMSKKLASGGERIVLDVKVGAGAFMKTREQARTLARALVSIGNQAGVATSALLTGMQEPLGRMVGNALEVSEVVELLLRPSDAEQRLLDLCLTLAAHGLTAVGRAPDLQAGRAMAQDALHSGRAAAKFAEIVHAQGGPDTCEDVLASLPSARHTCAVKADQSGIVTDLNAQIVGELSVAMGAGRQTKADNIDPAVGIKLNTKIGDRVGNDDTLATLYVGANNQDRVQEWTQILCSAYQIDTTRREPFTPPPLVLEEID